ncbi:MAG: M20/M25/M40 family metallo-hydrolase [Salinibacterium sp.]|nr:M20/M25/M40 family metallo-hydrolase [Salinibacterium sp.]
MKLPQAREIDRSSAEKLLAALIGIASVNPAYDAASPGENALGDAIADFCATIGMTVERPVVVDGRRNLVARLSSGDHRRTLLIEAHLDTVGLPAGAITPTAEVKDGRITGRGACDVKGGIAAALLALADLHSAPLSHTDVVLLGAIDEEFEFRGISHFIAAGMLPDAAVVIEPTGLRAVNEHNGVVRIEIVVDGRAAHTSRPDDGHNAIRDALTLVDSLDRWNASANADRVDDEPDRILAVTTIEGGSAINIVPDSCRLGIDLRIRPRDLPQVVLADLREFLGSQDSIAARVDRELLLDGGMFTSVGDPLVVVAGHALTEVGLQPEPVRVPYGTDGSKLSRAGVPTIVFGPGSIEQAHSDDEWVELDDVVSSARVLSALARRFDGHAP